MSRTYTFTATTYGGRTANHSMYMNTMQAWSGGKRVGCWRTGSTDYYGAVSFIFNSGDLATVRGCTIESIKLSLSCSSTFAYSEELIYEQKVTDTVTDWTIPNYAHEVTVPRYGTVPIIDVTVLGVPDYGYVVGGYYRTYAYCDVTGGTLTVVTAETSKTITYNGNGGTSPSPTVVWGEGSWEGVVTTTIPTRTGYSFNGWNTQANGGGTSYQPADDITLTSDIILYAQWTALKSVLTGATNANITEATTVSWTNYGSFTNKLRFIFGSVDSGEISVSGSSYSYTIPSSWYNQIPNSTSGTATVYLYTYANGTLIGSSSKTFTASVKSSVVPAIGSISATGVDLMWGLYLQGHSSVTISVSNCSAGSGATIASYSIQGHGLSYSENRTQTSASATSAVFTVSGSQTYTATITDSRGRTASRSVTITVTAYAAPAISSVAGIRCDSDGTANPTTGTSIKASATFTYSAVGSNTITSSLSYKKHTDQAYTQVQTGITSGSTYIFAVGLAEISSSYDVQVEVTDTIGNTATYTIIVPPVVGISFGLRNDRARFGGPVEKAGLQVDWPAEFNSTVDVTQRRCSATLSSAGWYRVLQTGNPNGSNSAIIDIKITRNYNYSDNEAHYIRFIKVFQHALFVDETSTSNALIIDKIRYTTDANHGYVDVHYTASLANTLCVDFDVATSPEQKQLIVSETLQSVADAPSGETVLETYTFAANTNGDVTSSYSITKSTGRLLTLDSAYRYGKVVHMQITAASSSTASEGSNIATGTLNGAKPSVRVVGTAYYDNRIAIIMINTNGAITVRSSKGNMESSYTVTFGFTFICS